MSDEVNITSFTTTVKVKFKKNKPRGHISIPRGYKS